MARECPAEAVNHASHGIEAVEPTPTFGDERRGIGDWRSEHPELDEKGSDVLDVAIEGVESGKPEADAESSGDCEKDKERKPEGGERGVNAVRRKKNNENDEADGEVDESGEDGRKGEDEAREIDFGDDALIVDDDVGSGLQGGGEIDPGDERGKVEDGIGKASGRKLGETSEEKSEHDHGEKRLKHDPGDADDGLLVADFDVAPDEEVEELAVAPKLAEAKLESRGGRLDAHDGRC